MGQELDFAMQSSMLCSSRRPSEPLAIPLGFLMNCMTPVGGACFDTLTAPMSVVTSVSAP